MKWVLLPAAMVACLCGVAWTHDDNGPISPADRLASPTKRFLTVAHAYHHYTVCRELRVERFKQAAAWVPLYEVKLQPDQDYVLVAVWGRGAREVGVQLVDAEKEVVRVQWDKGERAVSVDKDKGERKDGNNRQDRDEAGLINQVFRFRVSAGGHYEIRVRLRQCQDPMREIPCYHALFSTDEVEPFKYKK
jgi:hypothetical protein